MATLLELGAEFQALYQLIEEADDELSPEVEKALDSWWKEISGNVNQKLDGYCALMEKFALRKSVRKAEVEGLMAIVERLRTRVRVDETNDRLMKDRLLLFMESHQQATGKRVIETERYKLSLCNNGGKAPMKVPENVQELPTHLRRIKWEPDTDAIRAALEAGKEIDGCRLLERGRHVRIG
jgi:hypothetical protein